MNITTFIGFSLLLAGVVIASFSTERKKLGIWTSVTGISVVLFIELLKIA